MAESMELCRSANVSPVDVGAHEAAADPSPEAAADPSPEVAAGHQPDTEAAPPNNSIDESVTAKADVAMSEADNADAEPSPTQPPEASKSI